MYGGLKGKNRIHPTRMNPSTPGFSFRSSFNDSNNRNSSDKNNNSNKTTNKTTNGRTDTTKKLNYRIGEDFILKKLEYQTRGYLIF